MSVPDGGKPASSTWPSLAGTALRVAFGLIWAVSAALTWTTDFASHYVGYLHNAATGQPAWSAWWFELWIGLVTPHAGATLPLVGALAGGPVGAAAGLVLQGVLGKPLGKAAGSRYQVTGSWDKPQITLIGKDGSRAPKIAPAAPEAAPAPSGGTTPADGAAPKLR